MLEFCFCLGSLTLFLAWKAKGMKHIVTQPPCASTTTAITSLGNSAHTDPLMEDSSAESFSAVPLCMFTPQGHRREAASVSLAVSGMCGPTHTLLSCSHIPTHPRTGRPRRVSGTAMLDEVQVLLRQEKPLVPALYPSPPFPG